MKAMPQTGPGVRHLLVCPSLSDEHYLLVIRQLANSLVRGCAGSLFLDRGETFVQSRVWQQGDAAAAVDWRASARSRELVVKGMNPSGRCR